MTTAARWIVLLSVALTACHTAPAKAQRMFLDTDGDGVATIKDGLRSEGGTSVSIWLETNSRISQLSLAARSSSDEALSFFSYEFILHAEGGSVEWGRFENAQPAMTVPMGPYSNATDFYVGYLGTATLPAGRYKLGTLNVRTVSGEPTLSFATSSPVWQGAETAFGSMYGGRDGDNTLKYYSTTDVEVKATAPTGDWGDAVGVDTHRGGSLAMGEESGSPKLEFGIRPTGLAQGGALQLVVTTTRPGRLQLRLFNVSGRLVRVIADDRTAALGEHSYSIGATNGKEKLPAGVYYFKLDASEGTRSGKVVILQ